MSEYANIRFRGFADLNRAIVRALPELPRDLDLVVGVPRSGMLVANLLALHLNLPFTDLEGFLEGRLIGTGRRKLRDRADVGTRKALVVDDSVASGREMRRVRARVSEAGLEDEVLFAAAFVRPEGTDLVDFAFEILPGKRCFEWNIMHHPWLNYCCVALEEVLSACPPPGSGGGRFPPESKALHLPAVEIGHVFSFHPESERPAVAAWLAKHGVRHGELVMAGRPEDALRTLTRAYRDSRARLLIVGDHASAAAISQRAGLPVLSLTGGAMTYPGAIRRMSARARHLRVAIGRRLRQFPPRRRSADP